MSLRKKTWYLIFSRHHLTVSCRSTTCLRWQTTPMNLLYLIKCLYMYSRFLGCLDKVLFVKLYTHSSYFDIVTMSGRCKMSYNSRVFVVYLCVTLLTINSYAVVCAFTMLVCLLSEMSLLGLCITLMLKSPNYWLLQLSKELNVGLMH